MWNKMKRVFKKKPKRDQKIEQNQKGEFGLRDFEPYKPEELIPAKCLGSTGDGFYKYEINGVIIEDVDMLSAQRRYLKEKQ